MSSVLRRVLAAFAVIAAASFVAPAIASPVDGLGPLVSRTCRAAQAQLDPLGVHVICPAPG